MAELDKPVEGTEAPRRRKVTKIGVVTSNKMTKTVVVAVESTIAHSEYGRTVRRTRKFMAHDEGGKCAIGDRVEIIESRPLSRRKRWRVQRILGRSQAGA